MTMAKDDTRQYSLESLRQRRDQGATETRVNAPEQAVDPDFWNNAEVVMPSSGKTSVHLRIDTEVLDWFRSRGRGHLTRMNAVLKSYVEAQKRHGQP